MTTNYTQPRMFFPIVWGRGNIPVDADIDIGITGMANMKEAPAARLTSVVTLVFMGSEVPSAGTITAEITKDGTGTGYTATFGAGTGTQRRVEDIEPGSLQFNANHRLGINITSSSDLSPADTVDVLVYLAVQPE